LKQFILKETPGRDRLVRLDGDDYHYLVRVRRLKPGDRFPVLLPERIPGTVLVLSAEGGILSGRLSVPAFVPEKVPACAARPELPSPVPPVVLFQALPKGAKIDLIIRQAAEGALSEVVVFTAEHSVARPEKPEGKEARWRRIVKEARQQSGSAAETAVRFCPSLEAALFRWAALREQYREALGLLLHPYPVEGGISEEGQKPQSLQKAQSLQRAQEPLEQETFHDYLGNSPGLVVLAAGPEGGFSGAETAIFLKAGFRAVRMGDTVLRSETAALYGAAAVRIILLERSAWMLKKK
jgi:16S rRNA (uracil1498-N3)-methyltransferase